MVKEIIYAFFDNQEFDEVTCKVYCDKQAAGGGIMEFSGGLYVFEYEVGRAGSYFAVCKATKGNTVKYQTYAFAVFEDVIPNIVELSSVEARLHELQAKLGGESKTIDTLLTELLAYETGVTPLPYIKPVTCLNTNFCFCDNKDSIIVDETGHGLDNVELNFINQLDNKCYITYTHKGYWGTYLKPGSYNVNIIVDNTMLEDILVVL